jgi:hypothetical protein
MIGADMDKETLIQAFRSLLKEDMDTTEDVFYNAGVIDCIKKVEEQSQSQEHKKHTP